MVKQIDHQLAFISQTHVGALINVADINQDRVSILPLPSTNLRDATSQAAAISGSVVIGRGQDVAMQIRRVQDRDTDCVRLKRGSRTSQRWKCAEYSRTAGEFQKVAPRPRSVGVNHSGVRGL